MGDTAVLIIILGAFALIVVPLIFLPWLIQNRKKLNRERLAAVADDVAVDIASRAVMASRKIHKGISSFAARVEERTKRD